MENPYVFLLANTRRGTLYIGVTSDLVKRIWQHREGLAEGFTKRQGVKRLVWFERHATMTEAIRREKAMKRWNRLWKIQLVETDHPEWTDLLGQIVGAAPIQDDTCTHLWNPYGFPPSRE